MKDSNTGNWNAGNWNAGNWNAGNWNTGSRNTGYFNTETPTTINVFDIKTDRNAFDFCDKPSFICFDVVDGDYKASFKKSYMDATPEDRKKIFNIPNFDSAKFFEISGIDVRVDSEKEEKKAALIRKANELLEQAKNM